jgi:oligopeptide/dipeptide ABC transporter ATP-binding protein
MRQRVMIAMALALEPRVLIADEPTTALDVTIQAQVLDLLRRLTEERGTATILVTHDLGVLAGMADRVNVMYAGAVIESGTTDDLFAKPRHPYTVGLLRSIPRLDGETGGKLVPIEGRPPDLVEAPVGCSFYARCAWRTDRCATETPALLPIDGGKGPIVTSGPAATHVVACFNPVAPAEVAEGRPLARAKGATQ